MPPFDYEEDMPIVGVLDQLALIWWITFGVSTIVALLIMVA